MKNKILQRLCAGMGFLLLGGSAFLHADMLDTLQTALEKGNGSFKLRDILPSAIDSLVKELPSDLGKSIRDATLKNGVILPYARMAPEHAEGSFTLTGQTTLMNAPFQFSMYSLAGSHGGIIFELKPLSPFKFASLDKSLSSFDVVAPTNVSIIVSFVSWVDPVSRVLFLPTTLAVVAYTSLNLPIFQNVMKFANSLNPAFVVGDINKCIVTTQLKFSFSKLVPIPKFGKSTLDISLPFKIGLDFDVLAAQGKLEFVSAIIKKVELAGFKISIEPGSFSIAGLCSANVYISSQAKPLEFNGLVGWDPLSVTIGASMEHFYEPAFGLSWLGIGNLGLEIIFMPASPFVLVSGLPLGGLGLRGTLALGEGNSRTEIEVATKVAMPTKVAQAAKALADGIKNVELGELLAAAVPSVGIYGRTNQIDLNAIWWLFTRMVKSAGQTISWPDMPVMKFTDVEMQVIPSAIMIVDKRYAAGTTINAAWDFLGQKGIVNFLLKTDPVFKLEAFGTFKKIDTPYFKLSGTGPDAIPGTADDGPYLKMAAGITVLPMAILSSYLEIPPLGIKQYVDFNFTLKGLFARINVTIFGFATESVDIAIPTSDLKSSSVSILFKTDTLSSLEQDIAKAASSVSKNIGGFLSSIFSKLSGVFDIKINKMSGYLSGSDLLSGKLPKVTMVLTVKVAGKTWNPELKDLQFDFKNPVNSATDIAKKLVSAIF